MALESNLFSPMDFGRLAMQLTSRRYSAGQPLIPKEPDWFPSVHISPLCERGLRLNEHIDLWSDRQVRLIAIGDTLDHNRASQASIFNRNISALLNLRLGRKQNWDRKLPQVKPYYRALSKSKY